MTLAILVSMQVKCPNSFELDRIILKAEIAVTIKTMLFYYICVLKVFYNLVSYCFVFIKMGQRNQYEVIRVKYTMLETIHY